jgi:hypothetical protein
LYREIVVFLLAGCGLYAQSAAATLGWQDRWDQYLDRTYSWKRIGLVTAETAFNDAFRFDKCGRPPYCFPHHLGGALVRRTTRTSIEFAASGLLGEDLRRRPSGLTGFRPRLWYALTHAMLALDSSGNWRPAYSRFAGTASAVAVTAAYHGQPMTLGRLSGKFGWTATNYFQDSLFAEFEPDLWRLGARTLKKLKRSRD